MGAKEPAHASTLPRHWTDIPRIRGRSSVMFRLRKTRCNGIRPSRPADSQDGKTLGLVEPKLAALRLSKRSSGVVLCCVRPHLSAVRRTAIAVKRERKAG